MNKMKMFLVLQEWVNIGMGVDLIVVDSPHQNKDYAPYVVEALLQRIPHKQIPQHILKILESELIEESEPKKPWYRRLF